MPGNGELSAAASYGPRVYAETLIERVYEPALGLAVEIVGHPDEDPLEVFDAPPQRRSDAPAPKWGESDQSSLSWHLAETLGYGREEDTPLSEVGLQDGHAIAEGGRPPKMFAELMTILDDAEARPATITMSADGERVLPDDERQELARLLGIDVEAVPEDTTEYQAARRLVHSIEGFQPYNFSNPKKDAIMPHSYDMDNNYALGTEKSGQVVRTGTLKGAPVFLLRVDTQKRYDPDTGKEKRQRPGPVQIMKIISDIVTEAGDTATPVAMVTGNSYPSRGVAALIAGIETKPERVMGVATYGAARLAQLKGESTPAGPAANQYSGELWTVAHYVQRLKGLLGSPDAE